MTAPTMIRDFAAGDYGAKVGNPAYGLFPFAPKGAGVGQSAYRMAPRSSTKKSLVPTLRNTENQVYIARTPENGHLTRDNFGDFTLDGTDQGHPYGGLYIYKPAPGSSGQNITVNGSRGYAGSPPGETFGINLDHAGNTEWWNLRGCGLDPDTGEVVGTSPIGINNLGPGEVLKLHNCWATDSLAGSFTAADCAQGSEIHYASCTTARHKNGIGFNHEQVAYALHIDDRISDVGNFTYTACNNTGPFVLDIRDPVDAVTGELLEDIGIYRPTWYGTDADGHRLPNLAVEADITAHRTDGGRLTIHWFG